MDKLLCPKELAEILGVKPGTVFSWLSRRVDLPPFIKIGGSTRWREETVKNWIEYREKKKRRENFDE